MPDLATTVLSYGDNLDILRRYLPDATDAQLLAFGRGDVPTQPPPTQR